MSNDVVQIFSQENTVSSEDFSMESVRSMIRQMNEIDDQIKDLREDKKELLNDFVDNHNVPKKEVLTAIRMLKGDIDPETTVDVYTNIADLVD